ncbi:hypothetical protein HMI54_004929 [Coelomomyces lativittatus]|nr:hypothetical protein HMI56_003788 [Coelomomyces lativittatus]KAJ1506594.1 hypothetical protein HMI54_004929 [Coelomomyces lativittatus]
MYPKANRTSSMVVAQKCATVFKKLQVPLSHSLWKQLFPFLKHKIKLSPEKQSTESIKSSTENDTTLPPSKIRKVDENHSIALTKKNSVPPSNTSESIQKSNEELREKFDSMYEEYIDLHQFLLSSKNEINVFKNLAHTLVSSTPNSKEETLTLSELKQKATQYNANQLIQSIQKFKDLHEKLNTLRRKIIHQKCF